MTKIERIKLINCRSEILEWILEGDDVLSKNLGVNVPQNWSEFGKDIFEYSLNAVSQNPESQTWWTYLPIIIKTNTVTGTCGFKGEPKDGIVEIGYEVAKSFRNKGYASEMVNLLIEIAFKSNLVNSIIAHTLALDNPSVSVLKKCEFKFVKEFYDKEDGMLWQWRRDQ